MGKDKKNVKISPSTVAAIGNLRNAVRTAEALSSHIKLEEFSSLVSHEIANIVNNLNFHIYKIKSDKKKKLTSEDLEKIGEKLTRVVGRFSTMITELRMVAKRTDNECVTFNFPNLVKDAVELNLASIDQESAPDVTLEIKTSFFLNGIYSRYFGLLFLVFKFIFSHRLEKDDLKVNVFETETDLGSTISIEYNHAIDWSELDREIEVKDFSNQEKSELFLIKKLKRSLAIEMKASEKRVDIDVRKGFLVSEDAA